MSFDPLPPKESLTCLEWYIHLLHEGQKVEVTPCETYCKNHPKIKAISLMSYSKDESAPISLKKKGGGSDNLHEVTAIAQIKTDEAFKTCMKICGDMKQFAQWHNLN